MQTVLDLVRQAASRTPAKVAILDPRSGCELRYRDLLAAIERAAAGFGTLGVRRGDRVAVVLPNSVEACLAVLGLHRAGAVPALLNPRLKAPDIAKLVHQGDLTSCVLPDSAALCDALRAELGSRPVLVSLGGPTSGDVVPFEQLMRGGPDVPSFAPEPDEPAFIFYTSGTTGLPKGVVIPQGAAEARVLFMATQAGYTFGPHNRILGLMPLYHVVGFFAVLVMALAFNGTYYVVSEFAPRSVLDTIGAHGITGLFATPTHLDALVAATRPDDDLRSLAQVTFAGATMPDRLLARINHHLPGHKVNIYGTTEAMNSLFMAAPTTGSRFLPAFQTEVRVVKLGGTTEDVVAPGEAGELLISTATAALFSGYLNLPEVSRDKVQNGWYRTSDVAVWHERGDTVEIELKGRADDTIISGGENIHPQ